MMTEDERKEWDAAIWSLRDLADNMPNAQDYPISNLLTVIDNIPDGLLPDGMLAEVKAVSDAWVKRLGA